MVEEEKRNFLLNLQNAEITANAKQNINLSTTYRDFGHNFNTFNILNTSSSKIKVYLDGKAVVAVQGSNGTFGLDWKDNIWFNEIILEELDAGTASANTIFMSIGRTGVI